MKKYCTKCETERELSEFAKNKNHKDGYHSTCNKCVKNYQIKHKEHIKLKSKQNYIDNKEYYKQYAKNYISKLSNEEIKKRNKNYNLINKEKYSKKHKEYLTNHKEQISIKTKEYNNKPINRERSRNINNKKYNNDPIFKLQLILRGRLKDALSGLIKGRKMKKSHSAIILLSCTIEEFKIYIESLFKPEMNWNNHGIVWELDHIIGVCNFDLSKEESQKQCFHYTNLQPLFKTTQIAESFGYKDQVGNRNKKKYIINN